jgi:hypothetical protein
MMLKLQDTIEVADVTEHVSRLADKIKGRDPTGSRPPQPEAAAASPLASLNGGSGADGGVAEARLAAGGWGRGEGAGGDRAAWSPIPEQPEEGGVEGSGLSAGDMATPLSSVTGPSGSSRASPHHQGGGIPAGGSGLERVASVMSVLSQGGSFGAPELSYGVLAAAADTLDDKLAVLEHKRR